MGEDALCSRDKGCDHLEAVNDIAGRMGIMDSMGDNDNIGDLRDFINCQ